MYNEQPCSSGMCGTVEKSPKNKAPNDRLLQIYKPMSIPTWLYAPENVIGPRSKQKTAL